MKKWNDKIDRGHKRFDSYSKLRRILLIAQWRKLKINLND